MLILGDNWQRNGWTHTVGEPFRKARVQSNIKLTAAWLHACERSGFRFYMRYFLRNIAILARAFLASMDAL